MAQNTLDAKLISRMFLAGAKQLESRRDEINELNVFPVPDGDTGTNMTLTIMSAAKDVYALKEPDMATLCKCISSGSLKGARGNSGVILSQLFRGFTKVIKTCDTIDIAAISAGCDKAVESAYKAVMQPKEGTILTVAKAVAEKTNEVFESGCEDIDQLFKEVIAHAEETLAKTPEMLPVLKEAGVVDSGGAGLVNVLKGFYDGFLGKGIEFTLEEDAAPAGTVRTEEKKEFRYLYHTTISLMLDRAMPMQSEQDVRRFLENVGDEVAIAVDESIVNVSINTGDPGMVIQKAIKYGELVDVQVINRRLPAREESKKPEEKKKEQAPRKAVGFISVSAGSGMSGVFKNLGTDFVIEGGQTMNPSTEDMLNAIAEINADCIFIFPNNKNIILAANQARDMTKDKKIVVIPTKTVPQGIEAMIAYVPDMSVEENEKAMNEAASLVKTGQITYAVRDTSIDGVQIHQDDFMGIGDSGILSNGKDIKEVFMGMLEKMCDDSAELVSIYFGSDVTEADAEAMSAAVSERFPAVEVALQEGSQPVYYYIVSVQ